MDENEMKLTIENVVFDTAKCTVKLFYDPTDESLRVYVFSRLSETQGSKKEWLDMSSYGQCCLETDDSATMRELADCIKNEPWLQVIGKEKTPFEDEKIKQAVLERLYNTRLNMSDMLEIQIENVIFDTAKSEIELVFDPTDGSLLVWISSKLSETHNSQKEWRDLTSYGQCDLPISDFATLRELADCIKNEPWLQIIGKEKTPFEDERVKQAALERLYNAGAVLGNFLAEKIKQGDFRDITDGDGWIKFWELVIKVERYYFKDHRLHEPFRALIHDLPNVDPRFEIQLPKPETRRLMSGREIVERPIEKYKIKFSEK